jgi:hypothetical protein
MFQQNKIKVEKSKSPIFSTVEKKRKRDEQEDKIVKKKKF